jgi:putative DNA primase/helicase
MDPLNKIVYLPLPAADARRLTSWFPEIVARWRPDAPQRSDNSSIRVGNKGSLVLYADGGWYDFEADQGGHGALSFVACETEDAVAARRFASEWLSRPGFGSFEPDGISEAAAQARAELYARRAQEIIEQTLPVEQWSSAAPPSSMLNLIARGLPEPYPSGLIGHLADARYAESALIARLTGAEGKVLGVQVGYLLSNGEKSPRIPQRCIFYLTLDPEERKQALFRLAADPRPEGEGRFQNTTFIVEGIEKLLATHMAFPWVPVFGLPGIGRLRRLAPIKGSVIIISDGDPVDSLAHKSLLRGVDCLLLNGATSVLVTKTPLDADADLIVKNDGIDALRALILAVEPAELSPDGAVEKIARARNPLERDVILAEEAKRLKSKGVRKGTLDAAAAAKHHAAKEKEDAEKISPHEAETSGPEPWPEPVTDIAAVLTLASSELSSYMVASQPACDVAALWSLHTFFVHHPWIMLPVSPRLAISAVSPVCGKTRLLRLVRQLVWHPFRASGTITAAVVYRVLDKYRPTLVLDEIDGQLRANNNPELNAVLRVSHERDGAYVPRNVPLPDGRWEVQLFSAWGTYVYTVVGELEPAMESRAIRLTLLRARAAELKGLKVLVSGKAPVLQECARKFMRWSLDQTTLPDVMIPEIITHRDDDNWRPLLQIAALVGGDWPQRAEAAVNAIAGETKAVGGVVPLLTDIQIVLDTPIPVSGDPDKTELRDRISTAILIEALKSLSEPSADWSTANNKRPINAHWLKKQLKGLVEPPENERQWHDPILKHAIRGYYRKHFEDAFSRYLPTPKAEAEVPAEPKDADIKREPQPASESSIEQVADSITPSSFDSGAQKAADDGRFIPALIAQDGDQDQQPFLETVEQATDIGNPSTTAHTQDVSKSIYSQEGGLKTDSNRLIGILPKISFNSANFSSRLESEHPDQQSGWSPSQAGCDPPQAGYPDCLSGLTDSNRDENPEEISTKIAVIPINPIKTPKKGAPRKKISSPLTTEQLDVESDVQLWLPSDDPSMPLPAMKTDISEGLASGDTLPLPVALALDRSLEPEPAPNFEPAPRQSEDEPAPAASATGTLNLDMDEAILAKLKTGEAAWRSTGARSTGQAWFGPTWLDQAGIASDAVEALVARGMLIRHPNLPTHVGIVSATPASPISDTSDTTPTPAD